MEDYGIPVRPEYVVQGDYIYQGGYLGIHELWKLNENQQLFLLQIMT